MINHERLRGLIERLNRKGRNTGWHVNHDGPEAATALAELSAKLVDTNVERIEVELSLSEAADRIAHLERTLATATARIAEVEGALRAIRDGDVPRPVASYWRNDCKPSKHDQCKHNVSMWQHCEQCTDVFIDQALGRAS